MAEVGGNVDLFLSSCGSGSLALQPSRSRAGGTLETLGPVSMGRLRNWTLLLARHRPGS